MNISCDLAEDGVLMTFTDKTDVDSCSTENLIGICSTGALDNYFYSGEVEVL